MHAIDGAHLSRHRKDGVKAGRCHESCAAGDVMHTSLQQQLIDETVGLVEALAPLVAIVARKDRDLASQIRRALSSVGLNLAEGFGNGLGNSPLRFESARGSLYEAQAGLRIAVAWGYLGRDECAAQLQRMHGLGGRIYGLMRR